MINITFHDGLGLIFNVSDWYELRSKHRIIGEFFGITQTSTIALPVALCPEEIYFLLKKSSIAKLVQWSHEAPSNLDKAKFEEETQQLFEEQKIIYREQRKTHLETILDKVIAGKIKEGIPIGSKEDVLEEELNKSTLLKPDHMIMPISTTGYFKGTPNVLTDSILFKYTTKLKCATFEDLWGKGYFITTARKFGGDFLVYLGDPVAFHAVYIVKCIENKSMEFNVSDVVAYGRFGNSVKKKFVLASFNSDEHISYISLGWMDA